VCYETRRGFLMKGFCVVLEVGYEKRQGGLVLFLYEPPGELQRRRKEDEKGRSGGLINRTTRLKNEKEKKNSMNKGGSQKGKEKPKRRNSKTENEQPTTYAPDS